MDNRALFTKIAMLPHELQQEVEAFIDNLQDKRRQEETPVVRKAGLGKGMIELKTDFDEPLEDFKEYVS